MSLAIALPETFVLIPETIPLNCRGGCSFFLDKKVTKKSSHPPIGGFFAAQRLCRTNQEKPCAAIFFRCCLIFIGAQVCFAILPNCVRATAAASVKSCYALPGAHRPAGFSWFRPKLTCWRKGFASSSAFS
jgi:hypothetical protein